MHSYCLCTVLYYLAPRGTGKMSLMDFGFSWKGKAATTSTMEEQGGNKSESSSDYQSPAGPIAKRSKQSYEATQTWAFKESWKKDFSWVAYDTAKNNMYCSVCREFPTHADGNALFVGTTSFRIQNLNRARITMPAKKLKQPKIIQLWLPWIWQFGIWNLKLGRKGLNSLTMLTLWQKKKYSFQKLFKNF